MGTPTLAPSLSLFLTFADRLHTLSEKSCHLEVYFSFFLFFRKKKLMCSCQRGRQTACINLSHAGDSFEAAIICSGCLILWGQREGPRRGAAFIHVKLWHKDLSCHSRYLAPPVGG